MLDGNHDAAKLLAKAVHQTYTMDTDQRLKDNQSEVCIDDFGIWIDPIGVFTYFQNFSNLSFIHENFLAQTHSCSIIFAIAFISTFIDTDSTAQYIHGYDSVQAEGSVYKEGLQCVVVLIGAYSLKTGLPVAGVVNQPFASKDENSKE